MFVKVKLYAGTLDGSGLVVELSLPRFSAPPTVLIWSERFFVVVDPTRGIYYEAFTYAVPPQV